MMNTLFKSPKFMLGAVILIVLMVFTLCYPIVDKDDPLIMSGRPY